MTEKLQNNSLVQELQAHQIELEFQNEELRITQNALQDSLEDFRELYDLAPVGYLIIDLEKQILKANLTATSLLNIDRRKILTLKLTHFIYSEDQDLFYQFKRNLSLFQTAQTLEIRMVNNDGFIFWARLESTYSKNLNTASQIRITFTDISEKKSSEIKLFNEKRKFENLIFALNQSALVSIVNSQGKILLANDNFCEMSGYNKEDLTGSNSKIIKSIFHEIDFFPNLHAFLSPEGTWQGVVCHSNKAGNLDWLECTITPTISDLNEKEYIAIYFDITDRKKAEELLLQSSKMASLGVMASGIAHEINNPLAIIVGKTNRIKKMMSEPAFNNQEVLADLDKIKSTSDRISKIIKGLHAFSRNTINDPYNTVSIKKLINETLELCLEKFRNDGIELFIENIFDVDIQCRPAEISQVILNLLNNAYDAVIELPKKWIRIEMRYISAERVQLLITDSGSGISKEIAEKIMLPFFSTKNVSKGTGLGLSISKRIIEDHWGNLFLDESSPNTCFILEIPIIQTLAEAEKEELH